MTLSLMEQACDGCSTVRGGQGLKVRARLCFLALRCRVLAAPTKQHLQCVLQRSRNEAPTDGASLRRLLHGARWTGTQCACSSLPPGTQMQSACRPEQAPALVVVCNGAAMELRVMEQACDGCSTVRGAMNMKIVTVFMFKLSGLLMSTSVASGKTPKSTWTTLHRRSSRCAASRC